MTEPTEQEPIVPPPCERCPRPRRRHRRPGALARFFGWLGPVYGSVYGRLNTEEWKRAAKMGLTVLLATGGFSAIRQDPTLMNTLVVPAGMAVLAAVLEAFRRLPHGGTDPPGDPPPPPA